MSIYCTELAILGHKKTKRKRQALESNKCYIISCATMIPLRHANANSIHMCNFEFK